MSTRITLDIDNEVLEAAQYVADRTGESLGRIISRLARNAISVPPEEGTFDPILGIVILPRRPDSPSITIEFVNELLNDPDNY